AQRMEQRAPAFADGALQRRYPTVPRRIVPRLGRQYLGCAHAEVAIFDAWLDRLAADLPPFFHLRKALDIAAHGKPQRLIDAWLQAVGHIGIAQQMQQAAIQVPQLARIEARRAAVESGEI